MRTSKLRKLDLQRSIESMNMMNESAKELILVYEQKTGTPWRGVGILSATAPEAKKRDRPSRDTTTAPVKPSIL